MSSDTLLTRLLDGLAEDDPASKEQLFSAIYDDLTVMADRRIRAMFGPARHDLTLEPADLVHETYLRLIQQQSRFVNRQQFFAIITKLMLRVLIDYQRKRAASKRPNQHQYRRVRLSVALDELAPDAAQRTTAFGLEELEVALEMMEQTAPRKADVMKMRVIWSMTHEQIADALEVSVATIERDWEFGKSWMLRELHRLREHDGVES